MDCFKIYWKNSARKELRKLDQQNRIRILEAIRILATDPYHNDGMLTGWNSIYKKRVGKHRILFQIQDREIYIQILKVGHRKEVYKSIHNKI